ncbi:MAG: hypothetical protein CEO22_112 [Candidatus Berkelbacteria bacterium Gr01-1014_85]|uniref:Polymerase nucleotidyl transferase domain-containing protein n=1 Tax=Candidatus Berkelbacteria bacterium Gr01-1014_85 TaxID=2017150 RepID=A0A554JDQ1_9BACT|nr:MAG: hypothetical protein CEO22_112 [Candidatus Berkelbacteria bacterium Gr01-1014_85]
MYTWQTSRQQTLERAVKLIASYPTVTAIALTGSEATGRATAESDIDLFIQVRPGRLWQTRLWLTLWLEMKQLRRNHQRIAGAICLNWWGTEFWPGLQARYPYRLIWQRVPINEKAATKQEPALWVKLLWALDLFDQRSPWLGNQLERFWRWLQIAKIRRHPLTTAVGGAVRNSDQELGFHPPKPSPKPPEIPANQTPNVDVKTT